MHNVVEVILNLLPENISNRCVSGFHPRWLPPRAPHLSALAPRPTPSSAHGLHRGAAVGTCLAMASERPGIFPRRWRVIWNECAVDAPATVSKLSVTCAYIAVRFAVALCTGAVIVV